MIQDERCDSYAVSVASGAGGANEQTRDDIVHHTRKPNLSEAQLNFPNKEDKLLSKGTDAAVARANKGHRWA